MKAILNIIFIAISFYSTAQCTPATATVNVTEPGCDGNSGQIEVIATGGATPYQYGMSGWNTQSSNIFTGLSAGTYNIRVVTADNCETWVSATINYAPMEFSGSVVQQTCWDYVAGSIQIVPSRGATPYSYSSDGGATYSNVNFFQGLDVGVYNYKVKDANGCIEDVSYTITKSHIGPSVTTSAVQCNGVKGIANITFIGTDNYTFSIDNNASVQNAVGFYSYTQLNAGTYLLQCSDINGCNESVNFTIDDENIQSTITNVVQETCNETNASFLISTTNGVGPYQYSIDGGLSFVNTDLFTNLDEGAYQTKVIDSRGCESDNSVTITNTGGVMASINSDTAICSGDNAYLYVNATGTNLSYTWNNGLGNSPTHAVTPSVTTQYDVVVSDDYNCTQNLSVNVAVNTYPNLNVSLNQIEMCQEDSVEVFVVGADSYLWSNGDTTSTTVVKAPFGESEIIAYGYNGTCESSLSIPVIIHYIDASITDSHHICKGNVANIYVNSVTPVVYEWNNGLPPLNHHTVSPQTDTYYQAILTNSYGCEDTLGVLIEVDDPVTLSVTPQIIESCINDEFLVQASGAVDYVWSTGETTDAINYQATANENLTVTGVNGECSDVLTIPVTVLPSPTLEIEASATSINTGESITFGVGNSNASSYFWEFGDGGTSNTSVPTHSFLFTGGYMVYLTGNIGVCESTDSLLVYVGVAGINNKSLDKNITIYPNPVKDVLTISVEKENKTKVTIVNALGKAVATYFLVEKDNKINTNNWAKGIYYLKIENENGVVVRKIIKE